jgi:hypothetical protein
MNKFLITTALVASFVTTNAMATPEVSVNGSIDSKFVNNSQKEKFRYDNLDSTTGKKLSNNNIAADAYINFNIKGEVKEGLKYGGLIKLNANTSKSKKEMFDKDDKQSIAEQVMAYLESGYGRVEVGNYTGVTESMKVNAGTFASATGGINGDSQYYWNQYTMQEDANSTATPKEKVKTKTAFLQTANLPTNELGTFGLRGVNAAKINYYTSEFSGFRFGATFTPNTKVHGTASSVTSVVKDKEAAGFKNVFETGLSYTSEIKDVGVKFAVVGEFGKNQESGNADQAKNKKNLRAYEVGTNLSYKGFTVGGSYGDWGKYGASTAANAPEFGKTSYWTAGVGYANGPLSASVTHLQGKKGIAKVGENKKHNTLKNTVIGVDYKVAPGVMPYVEFSSFKMNQASQADKENNNKGHMIMTGVKLNF